MELYIEWDLALDLVTLRGIFSVSLHEISSLVTPIAFLAYTALAKPTLDVNCCFLNLSSISHRCWKTSWTWSLNLFLQTQAENWEFVTMLAQCVQKSVTQSPYPVPKSTEILHRSYVHSVSGMTSSKVVYLDSFCGAPILFQSTCGMRHILCDFLQEPR